MTYGEIEFTKPENAKSAAVFPTGRPKERGRWSPKQTQAHRGGGAPAEGLVGGGLSPRRESCWEETQEQQSGLDLHSGRLSARGTEGDRGAVGTDSS